MLYREIKQNKIRNWSLKKNPFLKKMLIKSWSLKLRFQIRLILFMYFCKALHFLDVWFRCLMPIVFYCFLLFYIPLPRYCKMQFVLMQLANCYFTHVICLFHCKTWLLYFAQFSINQWKTTISHYRWCISTYNFFKMSTWRHHLFI